MNVLSIDVGIKNLALCLFNIESKEKYKLLDWSVVNLCNEVNITCKCGKNAKIAANITVNNTKLCLTMFSFEVSTCLPF